MKPVTVINRLSIKPGKMEEFIDAQQNFAAALPPCGLVGGRRFRPDIATQTPDSPRAAPPRPRRPPTGRGSSDSRRYHEPGYSSVIDLAALRAIRVEHGPRLVAQNVAYDLDASHLEVAI